jgi:hypothetical protein
MQDLDDNALLQEYVEHDSEAAFAAIVARHVNKVYSVALRHTLRPHQAEEITQAVFVILAKKSRQLSKAVVLSGWLYQTARLAVLCQFMEICVRVFPAFVILRRGRGRSSGWVKFSDTFEFALIREIRVDAFPLRLCFLASLR